MNDIKIEDTGKTEDTKIIRSMIQHEDNLINDRLSWTLTSQSFLVAGISLLWGKPQAQFVLLAISVFGILANCSILYSLVDSVRAINSLKDKSKESLIQGSTEGNDSWFPWIALPVLLILFWLAVSLNIFVAYCTSNNCN